MITTTQSMPGMRRRPEPCWTIVKDDGTPAGFEESEDHYDSKAAAEEAAPGYQCEGEPPVRVVQVEGLICLVVYLACGELFVYEGDVDQAHFADEAHAVSCLTAFPDKLRVQVSPGVWTCVEDDCVRCRAARAVHAVCPVELPGQLRLDDPQ